MWLIKIIIITIVKKDFVLFIEKAEAFPLKSCSQVDFQYGFLYFLIILLAFALWLHRIYS